jgi:hypothetical protein
MRSWLSHSSLLTHAGYDGNTMRQKQRVFQIGVVLVLLGITVTIVGIIAAQETQWVVDPLRYQDVAFLPGYPTGTIHITASDGQVYRLPARLWDAEYDGLELTRRLGEGNTAVVRVRGGNNRLWFGYPTIEFLETQSLRLEAPPVGRARTFVAVLAGPLLSAAGLVLARRARRQLRQLRSTEVAAD